MLDFLDTEYFQSLLFEVFNQSYEKHLKTPILDSLRVDDLYKDHEKVHLPKIITFIYRLQSSNILINKIAE